MKKRKYDDPGIIVKPDLRMKDIRRKKPAEKRGLEIILEYQI